MFDERYESCSDCTNYMIPFNDGKNYYIIEIRDHYKWIKRYIGFMKLINKDHTIFVKGGIKEGIDYKFVRISIEDPSYLHGSDDAGWELNKEDIDALINRLNAPYENTILNYDGDWEKISENSLFRYIMIHMNYEYDEYYNIDIPIPDYYKLLNKKE